MAKRDACSTLRLKDRSRGHIVLNVCDGVVRGAMGSEPQRFLGKTVAQARRIARYGGTGVQRKRRR